ncbi:hypothetical protein DL93DRAFT_2230225 [Clavulina sp. PMI_390]|nr:hypothetical protein DL93DRAFT_2230225 [Clavulina sp. PMI_390]
MSVTPGPPPSPILGSFLIGVVLSSILFGAVSVQAKLYLKRFPNDSWVVKAMVIFLWLAQLVEVGIASGAVYGQTDAYRQHAETSRFVRESQRGTIEWETQYWSTHLIITAFVVQSFFAYRLWALSRHWMYTGVMGVLILVNIGLGIVEVKNNYVRAPNGGALDSPHHFQRIIALTTLSAVTDLALAVGVVLTLRKQRTGFLQTDRVVNWIILYGIASGMATTVFAIAILIATLIGDGDNIVGAGVPFGGVYIASTFAHLHSRTALRSRLVGEHHVPVKKDGTWPSSFDMESFSARPSQSRDGFRPSITTSRTSRAGHTASSQSPIEDEVTGNDGAHANFGLIHNTLSHETNIEVLTPSHGLQRSPLNNIPPHEPSSSVEHHTSVSSAAPIPTRICLPPPPRFNPSMLRSKGRGRAHGWE